MPQEWQVAKKGADGVVYYNNAALVQAPPTAPVHFAMTGKKAFFEYKGPSGSSITNKALDIALKVAERCEKSFVAEAPANSPHAAKLAQIAMAVQEDRPRRNPKSGSSHMLISGGIRRPQIQHGTDVPRPNYAQYDAEDPQQSVVRSATSSQPYDTVSDADNEDGSHCPSCPEETSSQRYPSHHHATPGEDHGLDSASMASAASMATSATGVSSVGGGLYRDSYDGNYPPHSQQVERRSSVHTTPHVTRYATETTTAYQVDNGQGHLYVSAPVGSNEARLFDAIADAHSAQGQRKSHETKDMTRRHGHHSKQDKKGWW
ncbi:hypothetical protein F5Y10DRAFT_289791 [Nemania abortiva]|nr:hypothetical protein F5Y10DRAFT_289791 [Nemania abortiva]